MKIGILCESDSGFQFFRQLLPGHQLVRLESPEQAAATPNLDGLLLDAPMLARHAGDTLPAGAFAYAPREEERCPCVISQAPDGQLRLQCGRQAEALRRSDSGRPAAATSTLVFQCAAAA